MRALGTIVNHYPSADPRHFIGCALLDPYDHWEKVDPRLAIHHQVLSQTASAFGHDLVHQASYAHEILRRLPDRADLEGADLVLVGSMTEAFLVSVRSAYDITASPAAYIATGKPGQAPQDSLRALAEWARKNPTRVKDPVRELLSAVPEEFWQLRSLRDHIVHRGADAIIHTDRKQFNLWIHGPKGWVTREPLLPFLARHHSALLAFADRTGHLVHQMLQLPADRIGSRIVEGVMIHSLHELQSIAPVYAAPSP